MENITQHNACMSGIYNNHPCPQTLPSKSGGYWP